MNRLGLLLIPLALTLTACAPAGQPTGGQGVYKIKPGDAAKIQYRMLDEVNSLRAGAGAPPVELNSQLNAAAETHARDMSRQGRAWPFGSDQSSPYDRIQRAGFSGQLVAELYAQTFETETEILAAWVRDGAWGPEILQPQANQMGFAWTQDSSGLIWWDIILGDSSMQQLSQ